MLSSAPASRAAASPLQIEILQALLGLFAGFLLLRVGLLGLLGSSLASPLPPVPWWAWTVLGCVEAALCVLLAAGALARPLQRWLDQEQRQVRAREASLRRAAGRQEFSADLAAALGHSVDEAEARWVIQRALEQLSPQAPAELLLTTPAGGRLQRALGTGEASAGCPVQRGGDCPAIRSGQARGGASTDLGACRFLVGEADGSGGACHGLCLPVTISGQALGVLHTRHAAAPSEETRVRLQVVAEQAGARLGLFRAMAASQQAASTDELTGLLNRRALQQRVALLEEEERGYALLIADIDHFKRLNDTWGHQAGDRALQAFGRALREAARPDDVVARLGGEEFVLVLPDASAQGALQVVRRIQQALPRILAHADLPGFTASFGVADPSHGPSLEARLRAADAALYAAKDAGRDQAVIATPLVPPAPPRVVSL